MVRIAKYEVFENAATLNGSKEFNLSFTGKELDIDIDTGLYYYNARWYDPTLGRFLTEDPARSGINWLEYCNDNPLKYTDPNGEANQTTSDDGLVHISFMEGSQRDSNNMLIVYNDEGKDKGNATKGFGILLHHGVLTAKDLKDNPPQTEKQAYADLKVKAKEFENMVNNRLKYESLPDGKLKVNQLSVNQKQFDALVSVTFNNPARGKEIINLIRSGATQDQIKNAWLQVNPGDDPGWSSRHAAEYQLFSGGDYATKSPY